MRKGLFLGALLASLMIVGTASAERNDSDDKKASRGLQIKERVLEKQRHVASSKAGSSAERTNKLRNMKNPMDRMRPKGELYGDQASRSGKSQASRASGRNLSATGSVNTPSEIRAMRRMINPMYGAYRTSQAAEGTDSYGGQSMVPNGKGQGSNAKNLSATGSVNTPSEIRNAIKMINPMNGAYRISAAAEGTDSYGGKSMTPAAYGRSSGSASHVHMKNERGQVNSETRGNTATAMKNRQLKETVLGVIKAKMAQKAKIEGR